LRSGRVVRQVHAKRGDIFVLSVSSGGGLTGRSAITVVKRLRPAVASWYGLYGEGLACGGTLGVNQIGVAHKTLKCGTKVTISYHGRTIVAPVIDRGPFITGREFDLSGAAARALHFDGVDTVLVSQ
jgi:rare lipoprotein A (peptidoglycan hydrolase)